MKIHLVMTADHTLHAYNNTDYEILKKKVAVGEIIGGDIYQGASVERHQKYRGYVEACFENWNEKFPFQPKNVGEAHDIIKQLAGFTKKCFDINNRVLIEIPRSISFAECDAIDFEEYFFNAREIMSEITGEDINEIAHKHNLNKGK